MGIFDALIGKPVWIPSPALVAAIDNSRAKAATKVSSPTPNVANLIAAHIRRIAPELAKVPNLWFSGSNVWRWLYAGDPPAEDADIDVFFCGPHTHVERDGTVWRASDVLIKDLGIPSGDAMHSPVRTGRNLDMYGVGIKALFNGRKLDVWSGGETVAETLNNYPTASHAHCRAAFSFTEGLVVLPNEAA